MSETLHTIQDLLTGLARDIRTLAEAMESRAKEYRTAMEDLAAHILALEGIVITLLRDKPEAVESAKAWIGGQIKEHASGPIEAAKAEGIADKLLEHALKK
ncbi:MAG: hypothetical protein HY521_12880 [Proteobacteria bacterium]|nr:hypothetical protein [Pseudomonadota bacterium]